MKKPLGDTKIPYAAISLLETENTRHKGTFSNWLEVAVPAAMDDIQSTVNEKSRAQFREAAALLKRRDIANVDLDHADYHSTLATLTKAADKDARAGVVVRKIRNLESQYANAQNYKYFVENEMLPTLQRLAGGIKPAPLHAQILEQGQNTLRMINQTIQRDESVSSYALTAAMLDQVTQKLGDLTKEVNETISWQERISENTRTRQPTITSAMSRL